MRGTNSRCMYICTWIQVYVNICTLLAFNFHSEGILVLTSQPNYMYSTLFCQVFTSHPLIALVSDPWEVKFHVFVG